jgi:hypothetical protein
MMEEKSLAENGRGTSGSWTSQAAKPSGGEGDKKD